MFIPSNIKRMKVSHVAHVKIVGQPTTYCVWPWMGGMNSFAYGKIPAEV